MKNEIKDLQIDIQRDERDLATVRQELLALKEFERKLVQSISDRKRLVARYGGK